MDRVVLGPLTIDSVTHRTTTEPVTMSVGEGIENFSSLKSTIKPNPSTRLVSVLRWKRSLDLRVR
jgi:hypothetical protein